MTRSPGDIRPGDTLVVPTHYGGLDEYGWNPAGTAAVEDVGDAVVNVSADAAPGGRRPVRVRLHPA